MKAKNKDPELINGLVGRYIHILDDEGYVEKQGKVVGKEDDFYIVKLFEFVTGSYCVHKIFKASFLTEPNRIHVYYDADDMNDYYQYRAPKRPNPNKDGKFVSLNELLEKRNCRNTLQEEKSNEDTLS